MPAGSNNTGRKIPKIPGSTAVAIDTNSTRAQITMRRCTRSSAFTSDPSGNGMAARTAAPIRCQRLHQEYKMATQPQNHRASTRAGNTPAALEPAVDVTIAETKPCSTTKGWLACCTTDVICETRCGVALGHAKWFPALTSKAKGTRNFTDAASHNAYRTCA